jgi:hypothetical protein
MSAQIKSNCGVAAQSISPFGAALYPNERTKDGANLLYFEEGGEWVRVSPLGTPLNWQERGEDTVSQWTCSRTDTLVELKASWFSFVDGSLRQGVKARAKDAGLLITDNSLRVALSAGGVSGKDGPWVTDDRTGKLSKMKPSTVYGATLPFEGIDEVSANRRSVSLGGAASAFYFEGKVGKYLEAEEHFRQVDAAEFAVALLKAVAARSTSSPDTTRQALTERLRSLDFAEIFAGRRGGTVRLK